MRRGRKARGLRLGDGSAAGLPTIRHATMRMTQRLSRAARLLCATTLALALMAAPAYAVDTPFAPRFAQTVQRRHRRGREHADDLPRGAAGCTTAQGGTAHTTTTHMGYVDVDADATTVDSSSATSTLPAARPSLWAGLYWGGDTIAGTGGRRPTRQPRHRKLKAGAGALPERHRRARRHPHLDPAGRPLPRLRDVTAAVAAAGSGTYPSATSRPARATTASPAGRCSSPTATTRSGPPPATSTTAWARSTRRTPSRPRSRRSTRRPPAPVTTKAGLLTFEGDAGIATETATFNGHALTDALNPVEQRR